MNATMSIMGLYNYSNGSVFDKFRVPDRLDKDVVIGNILMELAELEFVFPQLLTATEAIGLWSRMKEPVWERLIDTTLYEYDPIMNYDRTETVKRKETRDLKINNEENRDLKINNKEERDLKITDEETHSAETNSEQVNENNDTTTNSGSDNVKTDVSAWNDSSSYSPRESTTSTRGTNATNTGRVTGTGSDRESGNRDNERRDTGNVERNIADTGNIKRDISDSGTLEHDDTTRAFGNIGTTTTQQLIREQRDLVLMNVTEMIVQQFKERFCLLVY